MGTARPANVLLVDDNEDTLLLLEAILAPLGQRLVRARSGEEALACLGREEFAVVLLDVRMPGMDGFETAARIKARKATRHLPIIFLTGSSDFEEVRRGYAAGAVDFILKPFDREVLRAKVSVFVDLYNLRREAELLTQRALHDALTGLPNRTLFLDRLEMALARMRRSHSAVAVLFLDLDGFKAVNDAFGHEAGDRLLVEVAQRLCRCVRPSDSVARFGGDEFTILCENVEREQEAAGVAERIAKELRTPVTLGGQDISVTASIGVTLARDPDAAPQALIREADAAMYRAKELGKSCHAVYGDGLRAGQTRRARGEQSLRRALARDELFLVYQPQVHLESGNLVGLEALVRWDDPARGLVLPADFIPLAEQSGLISDIGLWVLKRACGEAGRWRHALPAWRPPTISINVSPRQLNEHSAVESIRRVLDETGTDPSGVCLEITEGVLMERSAGPVTTLTELKRLGIGIAVDDFGTGYTSIGHLRGFPVDVLKIDRTFVAGLGRDDQSTALTAAVISLAHALGLTVIAEGVESTEQAAELHALGCDAAQGFYLGRPKPWREIVTVARHLLGTPLPFLPEADLEGVCADTIAPAARPRTRARAPLALV
jgi:diguanylate cyclase (GGDEF)-like protein